MILADGIIGQMMEAVTLPEPLDPAALPKRDWTVGNMAETGRPARHITSLDLVPEALEVKTRLRFARYGEVQAAETRFEAVDCEDADIVIVAYGTSARVAQGARELAAAGPEGIKIGVFRPVSLWPFPSKALGEIACSGRPILVLEMSLGQLVEDVKLAIFDEAGGARPEIHLLGHSGGVIPTEEEVFARARRIVRGE
jgi:2-oxoglutarate ferredoxin oxidoreductase subunit alpha